MQKHRYSCPASRNSRSTRNCSMKLAGVNLIDKALEIASVYKTWQSLFSEEKIAPLVKFLKLEKSTTILDLGCGPGTNAHLFAENQYTGVDINQSYINFASRKFNGDFIASDATSYTPATPKTFDIILINSLMHHLDNTACLKLLTNASNLLSENGEIHILDVIQPQNISLKSLLARLDRGNHLRTNEGWDSLLNGFFTQVHYVEYNLYLFGLSAYRMFYFVGTARK